MMMLLIYSQVFVKIYSKSNSEYCRDESDYPQQMGMQMQLMKARKKRAKKQAKQQELQRVHLLSGHMRFWTTFSIRS